MLATGDLTLISEVGRLVLSQHSLECLGKELLHTLEQGEVETVSEG